MMKHFILIFVTAMTSITAVGCNGAGVMNIADLSSSDGGVVTLIGTIKTGPEVGLEECTDFYYLEDETGVVKVAQQDEEDVVQHSGKRVEIRGEHLATSCDEVCLCGNFIWVESITVLE